LFTELGLQSGGLSAAYNDNSRYHARKRLGGLQRLQRSQTEGGPARHLPDSGLLDIKKVLDAEYAFARVGFSRLPGDPNGTHGFPALHNAVGGHSQRRWFTPTFRKPVGPFGTLSFCAGGRPVSESGNARGARGSKRAYRSTGNGMKPTALPQRITATNNRSAGHRLSFSRLCAWVELRRAQSWHGLQAHEHGSRSDRHCHR